MRDGGKIEAAISVLTDVLGRYQPVKLAMRDWGKTARYAGSKDRAWVSGLVLDALRRKNSVGYAMGSDEPRALVLGSLSFIWGWDVRRIDDAMDEEHAPTALTSEERDRLAKVHDISAAAHISGDFPEWLAPHMARAFGEETVVEAQAMTVRASVDLRVNTLKINTGRAAQPLRTVKAEPSKLLLNAFHIPALDPTQRETSLTTIPAYSKGWVEVQDSGSQIAAAAANVRPGDQVLDFCAGGGGKTLAIAAALCGKGQVHAYDIDGGRLSALIPRLKRSGAHNVQVCHPDTPARLEALKDVMDVVFVDAPCTGTGTWRRKPDSKWRLKPSTLDKRIQEQTEILIAASAYVKPGGRLVYATCSFLMEEDEDRVAGFLSTRKDFRQEDAASAVTASGLLTEHGERIVKAGQGPEGGIRLTPRRSGTDGFFFAVMRRVS